MIAIQRGFCVTVGTSSSSEGSRTTRPHWCRRSRAAELFDSRFRYEAGKKGDLSLARHAVSHGFKLYLFVDPRNSLVQKQPITGQICDFCGQFPLRLDILRHEPQQHSVSVRRKRKLVRFIYRFIARGKGNTSDELFCAMKDDDLCRLGKGGVLFRRNRIKAKIDPLFAKEADVVGIEFSPGFNRVLILEQPVCGFHEPVQPVLKLLQLPSRFQTARDRVFRHDRQLGLALRFQRKYLQSAFKALTLLKQLCEPFGVHFLHFDVYDAYVFQPLDGFVTAVFGGQDPDLLHRDDHDACPRMMLFFAIFPRTTAAVCSSPR